MSTDMRRAVAWYAAHGIVVQRLLIDNGSAYRAAAFAIASLDLGVSQRFTKPYRPKANGKAEHFIRTLLTDMDQSHRLRPLWLADRGRPPLSPSPTTTVDIAP
jgi:transposase InsO family protein